MCDFGSVVVSLATLPNPVNELMLPHPARAHTAHASLLLYIGIYMYLYTYMCVCVGVMRLHP